MASKVKRDELEKYQQNFAKTMADQDGLMKATVGNITSATTSTISSYFTNPEGNSAQIASYMNALYKKNGIVSGTIKYFQSLLTFNHSIYPEMTVKSGSEMSDDISEYIGAANLLESLNLKYYAPYFLKQTLLNGVSFFYKVSDSTNATYIQFPVEWCRVYQMSNNVLQWELDMSKLKEEQKASLPKEITSAFEQYAAGNTQDEKKWTENKWYRLSDKAMAFSLDQSIMSDGAAVSEFASLILDSIQLEKAKSNVDIKDTIDTIRILHSSIPVDKDGKPLMSSKTAKIYDSALKRSLPKGITGITSPLKITNVPLNGSGNSKSFETVKQAQEQLFLSTGTSSSVFGSSTTSSNIVKISVQKDANWLFTKVLPMFENYYNFELSKYKSASKLIWKVRFIRQSNYTFKEDMQNYEKSISMGGSRLDYLAATGMSPSEVYGKLTMEQKMLKIDSIMLPKLTSHTMSSSETGSGGVGRPPAENPTDDTDRISDSN